MISAFLSKVISNWIIGLATAPVLFAAEECPELERLISRRFSEDGDVEKAWTVVVNSRGVEKTRSLAKEHVQRAADLVLFYFLFSVKDDFLIQVLSQTFYLFLIRIIYSLIMSYLHVYNLKFISLFQLLLFKASQFPNGEGVRDRLVDLAVAQLERQK